MVSMFQGRIPPKPSQASLIGELLQPLLDGDGVRYPAAALPCTDDPGGWDVSAPKVILKIAAAICRTRCPAIASCQRLHDELVELGSDPLGVWGGQVYWHGSPDEPRDTVEVDAIVVMWQEQSGIRTPELKPRVPPRPKETTE